MIFFIIQFPFSYPLLHLHTPSTCICQFKYVSTTFAILVLGWVRTTDLWVISQTPKPLQWFYVKKFICLHLIQTYRVIMSIYIYIYIYISCKIETLSQISYGLHMMLTLLKQCLQNHMVYIWFPPYWTCIVPDI